MIDAREKEDQSPSGKSETVTFPGARPGREGLYEAGPRGRSKHSTRGDRKLRQLQTEGTARAQAERWGSQGVSRNWGSRKEEEDEVRS